MLDISELKHEREQLLSAPQSSDREYRLTVIDLEITIAESKINIDIAEKTLFLIDAYKRNGSMSVALKNGRVYTASPVITSCPIRSMWNLRNKAADMARLQFN